MKADHRPLLFWLCYEKKHFQKQSLRLGWSALSNAHCDCRLYFFALNSGTASQTRLGGAHTGVCWGGKGAGGARVGCGETPAEQCVWRLDKKFFVQETVFDPMRVKL